MGGISYHNFLFTIVMRAPSRAPPARCCNLLIERIRTLKQHSKTADDLVPLERNL